MKNKEKKFVFTGPFKDYCPQYVEYKREIGFSFGESSFYSFSNSNFGFKPNFGTFPKSLAMFQNSLIFSF